MASNLPSCRSLAPARAKDVTCHTWPLYPLIPALGGRGRRMSPELEASLVYTVSSRTARVSKTKTKEWSYINDRPFKVHHQTGKDRKIVLERSWCSAPLIQEPQPASVTSREAVKAYPTACPQNRLWTLHVTYIK